MDKFSSRPSTTLKGLYIRGVIFPAIIVVMSMGILSIIDNNDYTTEWMTKESVIFMSVLFSFIDSAMICILALTIFLNNKIIRTSGPKTFLWWFLLPMTCIVVVVVKGLYHRQSDTGRTNIDLLYMTILNLPFVIGLIWTYILFKKSNARTPWVAMRTRKRIASCMPPPYW